MLYQFNKNFTPYFVKHWQMNQKSPQQLTYNKQTYQKLQILQSSVYNSLSEFEKYFKSISSKKTQSQQNTQKIHHVLLALLSRSFKPLCYIMMFLDDRDIFTLGATCKLAYKLLYSPLGYRLTINLRPIVHKVKQTVKQLEFSQSAFRNLSQDKSLIGLDDDQDDKIAILTTMKTKLIATKQKIKQLDKCNQKYEKQNQKHITQLTQINIKMENYQNKILLYKNQIEKFVETIHQNAEYIKRLKDQQQNIIFEKQKKITVIQTDRQKLKRQRELLIKKIKNLEEEKRIKEVSTQECQKIFNLMRKITSHTKSQKN